MRMDISFSFLAAIRGIRGIEGCKCINQGEDLVSCIFELWTLELWNFGRRDLEYGIRNMEWWFGGLGFGVLT